MSSTERASFFHRMCWDSSFDGVVLTSLENVMYFNMQNYEKFVLHVAEEHLVTLNFAIYFDKNTHLKSVIDMEISETAASGIYVAAQKKYYDENKMKNPNDIVVGEERKPSSLDQLAGCFQALLVGLATSMVVFFVEIVLKKIK